MAKPSGAVTAGSLGYDVLSAYAASGYPQYMYFVILNHRTIPDYNDDNRGDRFCIMEAADQPWVVGAGNSITRAWTFQTGLQTAEITTNSTNSGWTTTQADTWYRQCYAMNRFYSADVDDRPHYSVIEVEMYDAAAGSSPTYESTMWAVELSEKQDDSYTGNDMEIVEKATAGDRTYRADQPCTAWHIMNMVADSYNKITYETRTRVCIPLFGYQ